MNAVNFKLHFSDYTPDRLSVVKDILILASKSEQVTHYEAFSNFAEVTCSKWLYDDLQHLINN